MWVCEHVMRKLQTGSNKAWSFCRRSDYWGSGNDEIGITGFGFRFDSRLRVSSRLWSATRKPDSCETVTCIVKRCRFTANTQLRLFKGKRYYFVYCWCCEQPCCFLCHSLKSGLGRPSWVPEKGFWLYGAFSWHSFNQRSEVASH